MYDRNVKSERILTKLRVLDYEYICDRIAKFHKPELGQRIQGYSFFVDTVYKNTTQHIT